RYGVAPKRSSVAPKRYGAAPKRYGAAPKHGRVGYHRRKWGGFGLPTAVERDGSGQQPNGPRIGRRGAEGPGERAGQASRSAGSIVIRMTLDRATSGHGQPCVRRGFGRARRGLSWGKEGGAGKGL